MVQTTAVPHEERTLGSIVGAIAASIDRVLPPGDVAALRRLRPGEVGCAAFWKLLATHLGRELPAEGPARDEAERRWAVIVQALARMRGLHDPRVRLGRALASAGLAEGRVLRLLRARHDNLADAVRVTAEFLANASIPTDHTEIALLILSDGRGDEETVRRRIARDYYAQTEKEERA